MSATESSNTDLKDLAGQIDAFAFDNFSKNAFRVMGLTGSANQKDVANNASSLKRANKLHKERDYDWDLKWFGTIARSDFDIQNALSRLSDPQQRLVERLFWFIEPKTIGDSVSETVKKWRQDQSWITQHDLAVLTTIRAATVDPNFEKLKLWSFPLKIWISLKTQDEFWSALQDLDKKGGFEPLVSDEEVNSLRDKYLDRIFTPFLQSIESQSLSGNVEKAKRIYSLLQSEFIPVAIKASFDDRLFGALERQIDLTAQELEEVFKQEAAKAISLLAAFKRCSDMWHHRLLQPYVGYSDFLSSDSSVGLRIRLTLAESLLSLARRFADEDCSSALLNYLKDRQYFAKGTIVENEFQDRITELQDLQNYVTDRDDAYLLYDKNMAYTVSLATNSYVAPCLCSCCLEPTQDKFAVSYEKTVNYGVFKQTNSLTMNMPICKICNDHCSNHDWIRFVIWALTIVCALFFLILFNFSISLESCIFLLVASIFGYWVWSLVFQVNQLHNHCSREWPVKLDSMAKITFFNPIYAERFAEANGATVSANPARKATRERFLFVGKGRNSAILSSTVICCILSPFVKAFFKGYQYSEPASSSSGYSNVQPQLTPAHLNDGSAGADSSDASAQSNNSIDRVAIKQQIESIRERAVNLETQMQSVGTFIKSEKAWLNRLLPVIKRYESAGGPDTHDEEDEYKQALSDYNSHVRKINSMVDKQRVLINQGNELQAQEHALVEQYNRGL